MTSQIQTARLRVTSLLTLSFIGSAWIGCSSDGGIDTPQDGGLTDVGPSQCEFSMSFVKPTQGATFSQNDDESGKKCANGLVTTVRVATSAPDGTTAILFADDARVGSTKVASAQATFTNISLPSKAKPTLRAQIGNKAACTATASITIDCGLPACVIRIPSGTYVNGRPETAGGDRVSDPNAPLAVKVEVSTDIEDGQPVALSIDGRSPQSSTASNGKAVFTSVTISPDGQHTLSAACTNAAGNIGSSGVREVTAISQPPELIVSSPSQNSQIFGVANDVDSNTPGIQFKVCGQTTTAAAIDLPADARLGQNNLCTSIGTGSAVCIPVKTTSDTCLNVTCPDGSAPFDVNITLSDKAGNQTKVTRQSIRCESNLPSVQIVSPLKYDSATPSTILNFAAGDTGTTPGSLKKTVIACTDKANAKAQLFAGMAGSTLSAIAGPLDVVAAAPADNCPTGFDYVAKFTNARLPESLFSNDGLGTLTTATQIRVNVTDSGSNIGKSPEVNLWVDSVPPAINLRNPSCGQSFSTGTTNTRIVFSSDTIPLKLSISSSGTPFSSTKNDFDPPTTSLPRVVTFDSVPLGAGRNNLTWSATDGAGNKTETSGDNCPVFIGNPPQVSIASPANNTLFGEDSNVDPTTHKYKTTITGSITGTTSATTVTIKANGTVLSSTVPITAGSFSYMAALPESDALAIRAEINDTTFGVLGAQNTVVVDTHKPTMTGNLTVAVDSARRRVGGVSLTWAKGQDYDPLNPPAGTRDCARYEIRQSAVRFDSEMAWNASRVLNATLNGALTTAKIEIGRMTDSFFAIRCFDKASNASQITTIPTTDPITKFDFIASAIARAGVVDFGTAVVGSYDLNGDGALDLAISSRDMGIFIYYGKKPGNAGFPGFSSDPDIRITAGTGFTNSFTIVRDFDGDGAPDFVVGDPSMGNQTTIFSSKAFSSKPIGTTMSVSDVPDNLRYILKGAIPGATSVGASVYPLGNFDGDSSNLSDVAVRAQFGTHFGALIFRGRPYDNSVPPSNVIAADTAADLYVYTSSLGISVAAGDLNGDGFSDMLISDIPKNSLYTIKGRSLLTPGTILDMTKPTPDADAVLTSASSDSFGTSIGLPGSIAGSGIQVVIGAPGYDSAKGRVAIATSSGLTLSDSLGNSILHSTTNDAFGRLVLSPPPQLTFDLDKDGKADVLACTATAASTCYLNYGQALPPAPQWSTSGASKQFSMTPKLGIAPGALGVLGDIDQDGFIDFIICSPGASKCDIYR